MKTINYYLRKPLGLFSGVFILGMLLSWSFPPHAVSWSLIPVLGVFLYGLEQRTGFWRSFAYGYLFYLGAGIAFIGQWFSYYFRLQVGASYILSYFLTLILCLYAAIYIGLICGFYARFKTRYPLVNQLLLFPSLWVLTELLRDTFFPRSWYALGYTQVNNLLFRGYFPVIGVYGVSFILLALSGLLGWLIINHHKRQLFCAILGTAVFASLSLALANIDYTQRQEKPLSVALVQPSIFSTKNYTMQILLEIENTSRELIQNTQADLIVLPETVFGTGLNYLTPGYLDELNQIVAAKKALLLFGTPIHNQDGSEQTGIVASTDTANPLYLKHHLVPFGEYNPLQDTWLAPLLGNSASLIENYLPGAEVQPPAQLLGHKFAFNICYENAINDFVAENAKNAEIMLNQSDLSWYGKTGMKDAFFQFSQARALENQRYFLQDGNTGDTAIIDNHGKVISSIPPYQAGVAQAQVYGYSGETPFEKWGNRPLLWLSLAITLLSLVYGWRNGGRKNAQK